MGIGREAIVAACLFGFSATALAQNVPSSVQPGHEHQILTPPPAPVSRPAIPFIQLPTTMGPAEAAEIKLRVKRLVIEGSAVYSAADVEPLYAELIGKEVTAADIYGLAAKTSAKYGQDGYLVARAVLTPQAVDAKAAG
jgi:hemolysin activation/secretion protein